MSIDFVRPMGVPPPRDPRTVPPFSSTPINSQDSTQANDRPVAPDPVRGKLIDVKG